MGIEETKRELKIVNNNIRKRISEINISLRKTGIRIQVSRSHEDSTDQRLKIPGLKRKSA
jgi:hypothetical protein